MKKRKTTIFKRFYKHILIFSILLTLGSYFINYIVKHQKDKYLNVQTELLTSKYNTNYKYFKIMSEDVFAIYKDNQKILKILDKSQNADTHEKSLLREELYNILKKRYKRLKNMGILQLHFHLKDNTSFLRMHKKDRFGDDLTQYRQSVVLANSTQKPQNGFEIGKVRHGFRFVYPLFYKSKHIGSVEIGFSSQKLLNAILDEHITHTHFLIAKKEINRSLWSDMIKNNYEKSIESDDFLLDSSSHNIMGNKNIHKNLLDNETKIKSARGIEKGKAFSLCTTYNKNTTVGSFIPIKNIQNSKTMAYLVVYSESDYLDSLKIEKTYMLILFISILSLLLLFSIYVTFNNSRLENMAHFDKLTSLPNRAFFYIELDIELSRAKRHKSELAVMFIDLDGFKAVNDTYGHDVGDKLLIEVAHRLTEAVRKIDLVARLGGDEFTVVLLDIKQQEDIITIANKIIEKISKDFIFNKKIINIGASIGISTFPSSAKNSDDLIKQSDSAMYEAKEAGKNRAIFYKKT